MDDFQHRQDPRLRAGRNARYCSIWRWIQHVTGMNITETAIVTGEEIEDDAHFLSLKPPCVELIWDEEAEVYLCRRIQ